MAWSKPEIIDGRIAVGKWPEYPDAFYINALFTWHGPDDPAGDTLIAAMGPGLLVRLYVAPVPAAKAAASRPSLSSGWGITWRTS